MMKSRRKKEELLQYGEIHPSLLGFRAVKPFSMARLKIGQVRQYMVLVPKGTFVIGALLSDAMAEEMKKSAQRDDNTAILGCGQSCYPDALSLGVG